jgi:orotidine-5'-phosphate decarboxylase
MLINVARSIARADDPGRAAAEMRDAIINMKYHLHL